MDLEMRHFKLVAAVADTGSLAAASLKLHLTPSALSHQLRDAEERLGTQLFIRRNRRLLLTGAGEKLLHSARSVLALVTQTEKSLGSDAADDLLRLSTACYTAYTWLPPVLRRWHQEFPRAELRIVLEATRQPIPALVNGDLDLALTSEPLRQPKLRSTPLFRDELVLVVPESHPLAARRHADAADIAAENLLTYDAPREHLDIFTRVFWPAGVEPQRVTRVPLTEALVELVRGGIGVAPLADWVLPRKMEGLRLVRITAKGVRRRWAAVQRAGHRPLPSLSRFVQLLREHVASVSPC